MRRLVEATCCVRELCELRDSIAHKIRQRGKAADSPDAGQSVAVADKPSPTRLSALQWATGLRRIFRRVNFWGPNAPEWSSITDEPEWVRIADALLLVLDQLDVR